jgi:hypothetical protein
VSEHELGVFHRARRRQHHHHANKHQATHDTTISLSPLRV